MDGRLLRSFGQRGDRFGDGKGSGMCRLMKVKDRVGLLGQRLLGNTFAESVQCPQKDCFVYSLPESVRHHTLG